MGTLKNTIEIIFDGSFYWWKQRNNEKIWKSVVTNNSDAYDEKYIKIKFNSVDDLSWNKALKFCNIIVVVSFFFFFYFLWIQLILPASFLQWMFT